MTLWIVLGFVLGLIPSAILWEGISSLTKQKQSLKQEIDSLRRRGSDFVANVSHELKTPLTSIKGYTETLKAGALKDPTHAQEFLNRIEQNTERLELLINDILDLSRIESVNAHLDLSPFAVGEVLNEVKEQFGQKLLQRNQSLVIDNSVETMVADRRLFEQCLSNLVENAHRYCPEGAIIEIHGQSASYEGRSHYRFDVVDNGPGISADDLPRIFERFYRADKSRNRLLGGTGLGLAIVKHVMISHGGAVDVQSERGQGCRFSLWFPAEPS